MIELHNILVLRGYTIFFFKVSKHRKNVHEVLCTVNMGVKFYM